MSNVNNIYDVAGIGIGPFNLGLSCLLYEHKSLTKVFFDCKPSFDWHTGIMPEWVTLQIPFIADLVTFADPTNKFSILNYFKETGRLYQFYIHENFYLSREEYNKYCKWVVNKQNVLNFNKRIESLYYNNTKQYYEIDVLNMNTNNIEKYNAKKLVIGTGTSPRKPSYFKDGQDGLYLSSEYMSIKEYIQNKSSITIVGSGQSGAEIFYDLLKDSCRYSYKLQWVGRPKNFFALDLNKLALELTSPDYKEFFSSLSPKVRKKLLQEQSSLYKGVNLLLLNRIYDYLYLHHDQCKDRVNIYPGLEVTNCIRCNEKWNIPVKSKLSQKDYSLNSEVIIFALGYQYVEPEFLRGVNDIINRDEYGNILVSDIYTIDSRDTIFVQNVGLEQHGIVTPDLGMGPYRNSIIANNLLNAEYFDIEERIAYQKFL